MRALIFCVVTLAVMVVRAEDILKEEDLTTVQDEKWFHELYSCFMDQAPCPEKMIIYKEAVPKYLEEKCASCSEKEKDLFEKLIKIVAEKYPKEFKELMDKLSPKTQE